mmetsp:Transcript_53938/g.166967  ORF Transcript_53938/g.166967 Transcript_53938/m.166967 type:complete len:209 (+) Transcript_53938:527-1153(+)
MPTSLLRLFRRGEGRLAGHGRLLDCRGEEGVAAAFPDVHDRGVHGRQELEVRAPALETAGQGRRDLPVFGILEGGQPGMEAHRPAQHEGHPVGRLLGRRTVPCGQGAAWARLAVARLDPLLHRHALVKLPGPLVVAPGLARHQPVEASGPEIVVTWAGRQVRRLPLPRVAAGAGDLQLVQLIVGRAQGREGALGVLEVRHCAGLRREG